MENEIVKLIKLHIIGPLSRILGLFLFIVTLVLCILSFFTFGAVAAIDAMAAYMPVWAAALIIGSAYIVLIIIALIFRKQLFVHPFISLLSKKIVHTQEELDIAALNAKHNVEIQLYSTIVLHLWNWLSDKVKNKKQD